MENLAELPQYEECDLISTESYVMIGCDGTFKQIEQLLMSVYCISHRLNDVSSAGRKTSNCLR